MHQLTPDRGQHNSSVGATSETGTPPGATIINNAVTVLVKAINGRTNENVEGARVYLTADTGGPLPFGTPIFGSGGQLTNVSGETSVAFNFESNQPVIGRVRRSTTSPLFKSQPISGTITSAGLTITAPLTIDE